MDRINAIRYIRGLYHDVLTTPFRNLDKKGFSTIVDEYSKYNVEKDGLVFGYYRTCDGMKPSNYVGYKNNGCSVYDLERYIDKFIADGFTCDYVRPKEADEQIAKIKALYDSFDRYVSKYNSYAEMGGYMRNFGCYVHYDGGSYCSFSKDYLHLEAFHNEYPTRGFHLNGSCYIHFADGSNSLKFNIKDLDSNYEVIFGFDTKEWGRFYTKRERFDMGLEKYNSFVVSRCGSTYESLRSFDNFDEAKKYAYEYAKDCADNTPYDLKQNAYPKPRDISDLRNELAAYLYYSYGNYWHYVIVEGIEQKQS